jgi:hypothetical protein
VALMVRAGAEIVRTREQKKMIYEIAERTHLKVSLHALLPPSAFICVDLWPVFPFVPASLSAFVLQESVLFQTKPLRTAALP